MTLPRMLVRLAIAAVTCALHVTAQSGALQPERPTPGSDVTLRYSPGASAAAFPASETVFGTVTAVTCDGARTSYAALVPHGEAGELIGTLRLPADAVYLHARFVTRTGHDSASDIGSMVYGEDGQPVPGARVHAGFDGKDVVRMIEAELAHHPDHHEAWRSKWFLARFEAEADALRALVSEDLERIGAPVCAGTLWLHSYGAMLLGDDTRARVLVQRALREYPEEPESSRALSDYEYLAYERQLGPSATEELARMKRDLVAAHPNLSIARRAVRNLAQESGFPYAATRAICTAWFEDEPLHPEPKLAWAKACLTHGVETERGARLAASAVNGYLQGDARLSGDPRDTMTRLLLPDACQVAARLAQRCGDHGAALAYALLSQRMETQTGSRGHELEAEIHAVLGRGEDAAQAWLHALQAGSTRARAELRALYSAEHGSTAGFETSLAEQLGAAETPERLTAPPFAGSDLEGEAFDLDALSGRVVVLNFWSLGCAPCKVEIPDLSRLADGFADDEVTFLAFAADSEAKLRSYLADHPFHYRVVASASAVAARYGVSSWPTHVILDRRSRIAAEFVGGGKGQDERLRVVIERLLAEAH